MSETLMRIKLTDIVVADAHNPRKSFDEDALARLAESIAAHGVTSPILVAPMDDGKYQLIAGERRFRASKLAKQVDIPAMVRDVGAGGRTLALIENVQREDLDPVEEAGAFAVLMDENSWNQKQLAAEVGVSTAQISQRLSLLQLPSAAQELIARGAVALEHTKVLRDVAKISPEFSAHLALMIAGEPRIEREQLSKAIDTFDGFVVQLAGSIQEETVALAAPEELVSEFLSLFPDRWNRPRWSDASVDAARSFGCLVEVPFRSHGSSKSIAQLAMDPEFVAGCIEQVVEREKQSRRDREAASSKSKDDSKQGSASGVDREAEAKVRAKARAYNFEVGEKLRLALSAPEFTLERAKLLAYVILCGHENRHLGSASFAVVDESTSEVNDRGTMKVMSLGEAREDLIARVESAKSAEEVLGILLQAFVASQIIDPDCLPASKRPSYSFPGEYGDPPLAERLVLDEALSVFKRGTNTYKAIKAKRDQLAAD